MAVKSAKKVFIFNLWEDNAILRQVLGICSTLAVTNSARNTLVMGLGVTFVTALSNYFVSLLRNYTPDKVRMMFQVLTISVFVIIVDIALQAYYPEISKQLGPYVGLIITNCIIMGRCEAFARQNPPVISFVDGFAAGLGYTIVLMCIAVIREMMGMGKFFGIQVLGDWWTNWIIMVMPPGAFFVLAAILWYIKSRTPIQEKK
jgi:Na+-transporting NADH:ubiquinone oxidoreductase subunit D